ncbi:hypothetical protein DENSPDRAFT_679463 [Dentipellis sp. KUC8613]|nr:hypothetical protein DENSPDRAFT_679463 [Dentipellis sp. KUC8613]
MKNWLKISQVKRHLREHCFLHLLLASEAISTPVSNNSVKLYAWGFQDYTFEDNQSFAAVLVNDLEKLKTWLPKDDEDDKDLPKLVSIDFTHNQSLDKDDEDGGSRGIAGLFHAYRNDAEFWVYFDTEPDFSIMEFTLAQTKPKESSFVQVKCQPAWITQVDGFESIGTERAHYLQYLGFEFITNVCVVKDPETLQLVQKLVKAHQWGVGTLINAAVDHHGNSEIS